MWGFSYLVDITGVRHTVDDVFDVTIDDIRVALRPPTGAEVEIINRRFMDSFTAQTGLVLDRNPFDASQGILAYPAWHITGPSAPSGRIGTLSDALRTLPAAHRQAALAAHLSNIDNIVAHRDGIYEGTPSCAQCVTEDASSHLEEIEQALSACTLDLTEAIRNGLLNVHPAE